MWSDGLVGEHLCIRGDLLPSFDSFHSDRCGCIISSHIQNKQNTHPIHHSQVHTHFKCLGVEVNSLWEIGEQLMVKRLNPVGIPTLEEHKYVYSHDMLFMLHTRWHESAFL